MYSKYLKKEKENFNELNKSNLKHMKRWGNIDKVMVLSFRDEHVCEECKKADTEVVYIDLASIPPVPKCKNEMCRCYYIGHYKEEK